MAMVTEMAGQWRRRLIVAAAMACGLAMAAHTAAGEADDSHPAVFGVILPMTGIHTAHGQSIMAGIQMRVNDLNGQGGIDGRKIVLRTVDDRSDKEKAAQAVTDLAADPEVLAILGPHNSGELQAMRDPALAAKIAVLAPKATQDGLTKDNPWIFRVIFNNGFQGKAMARFLVERLELKRLAIFTDLNAPYSVSLAANFRDAAKAAGAEIVFDGGFTDMASQPGTDYRPQLKAIKDSGAEAVFMPAYADEIQLLVRQAGEIGLDAILCGGDSWDLEPVFLGSGKRLAGSYMIVAFMPTDTTPEVLHFMDSAQRWGMEHPESGAALGFDAVTVAATALKHAKTKDRQGIRDALASIIRNMPLVTGNTTIMPDGEAVKSIYIVKVVPGPNGFELTQAAKIDP